ncbi:hypothetical protein LT337_10045 [Mycolicibacterium fortuitum]|nr:hypothetical protein LT337_10045 [Mycolicibacterium fortuitum]
MSEVDLIYDNGIIEGVRFELKVDMAQATDQQVGAVAAELDELRGRDFAKFDQSIKIIVGEDTSIAASTDLPDDTDHLTGLVRQLGVDAPAGDITWSVGAAPDSSRVQILEAQHPDQAVDAILRRFADRPPSTIEVSAANRVADPHWMIFNRFTPRISNASKSNWLRRRRPTPAGSASVTGGSTTSRSVCRRGRRPTRTLCGPSTLSRPVRTIRSASPGPGTALSTATTSHDGRAAR